MAAIDDVEIPSLLFAEGSAPSTPASGFGRIYVKTTGLFFIGDNGVEIGPLAGAGGLPTFSGVSLTKSATQAITQNTSTAVTFNGEDFDTDTYHDNSSDTSRITVPATGYYMVGGSIEMTGMADQTFSILRFRKNGTTVLDGRSRSGYSTTGGNTYSKIVALTAADYLEMMCEHSDAAADVRASADGTSFWAYRVA